MIQTLQRHFFQVTTMFSGPRWEKERTKWYQYSQTLSVHVLQTLTTKAGVTYSIRCNQMNCGEFYNKHIYSIHLMVCALHILLHTLPLFVQKQQNKQNIIKK